MPTNTGTPGDDVIVGTSQADVIAGGAGNDDIRGGAGADQINGGEGNDTIYGEAGNDFIVGGEGDDVIHGGVGSDSLYGNGGNDVIHFTDGDEIYGGFGDDLFICVSMNGLRLMLSGDNGFDIVDFRASASSVSISLDGSASGTHALRSIERIFMPDRGGSVYGGQNNDEIIGASGLDNLRGGAGNDRLTGAGGNDILLGQDGDDWLSPGSGTDRVEGGAGTDTVAFIGARRDYTITTDADGWTTVVGHAGTSRLFEVELLSFADGVINTPPAPIWGTSGADTLRGTENDDIIFGLSGDDVIDAGAGIDRIEGGEGNDALTVSSVHIQTAETPRTVFDGGVGRDTFDFSRISIAPNAYWSLDDTGEITVANYSLLGVETLMGSAGRDVFNFFTLNRAITIFAGGGDDEVYASDAELVDGGEGNDILLGGLEMYGGDGDDFIYIGFAGGLIDGGSGVDTVTAQHGVIDLAEGVFTNEFGGQISLSNLENVRIISTSGAVRVIGDAGANRIEVISALGSTEALSAWLTAGDGADVLGGGDGDDVLSGDSGDDLLQGGRGADRLDGGEGIDTATYERASAGVTVDLERNLRSTGEAFGDILTSVENLVGSAFNDVLIGSAGVNVLSGGRGDDWYHVTSGDVIVEADGEGANDRAFVLSSFVLNAGAHVETISVLDATGLVALDITGNELANLVYGNEGANVLRGMDGSDNLYGNGGADRLEGGAGDDILTGGAGNDFLYGGAGANVLRGGTGDDLYYVDSSQDTVFEAGGQGSDRILTSVSFLLTTGAEIEIVSTADNFGRAAIDIRGNEFGNIIYGNEGSNLLQGIGGADILYGNGGDDRLEGGAGDDVLTGGAGNDLILGGAGADLMRGGTGDDSYFVDQAGDEFVEHAGEGVDRLYTSISYALRAGVEIEHLSTDNNAGTDALNLSGNELANIISGNAGRNQLNGGGGTDLLWGLEGDDILDGGVGADTLRGGTGNDFFFVDDVGDTIIERAGEGTADRVYASASYALGAGVQVEIMSTTNNTGIAAINLAGNELANVIYGNEGANTLSGFAGADVLRAAGGDDSLNGGDGLDYLYGGAGDDVLTGGAGDDLLFGDGGLDRAAFSGRQGDYVITDLGAGRFRVVDKVAGRDGTDILDSVEWLSFSDGEHQIIVDAQAQDAPPPGFASWTAWDLIG